jgi:hypothetical protein
MSEVRLPAPVKAVPVEDAFDHGEYGRKERIAGAFNFKENEAGKGFWGYFRSTCPCGCGSFSALPVGLRVKPPQGVADAGFTRSTWEWDGNREAPTLTPSIHHVGHWHGWLKAGMWTQA